MDIISIKNLSKVYGEGTKALNDVSLSIKEGEIFGLLGENGAGKTTMIGIICGLVKKTSGTVSVMGKDVIKDYRFTRSIIGLVPQEITLDIFLSVRKAMEFQRGYYGLPKNDKLIDSILKSLALYDKQDKTARELSGGMQRRLLIAKALVHEPKILFLDEPTAGVDVQLRQDLWNYVKEINDKGTTIILTTHYIEEAEKMADRIGIIHKGEIGVVQEKNQLLDELGRKKMTLHLEKPLSGVPNELNDLNVTLSDDKKSLSYEYQEKQAYIGKVIESLRAQGARVVDMDKEQTSLEEIFVNFTKKQ